MSLDIIEKLLSDLQIDETAPKILHQKELAAERLRKARTKRDEEIKALKEEQALNTRKGELIQLHSLLVDECRQYVQGFLDQLMDWTNIELAIRMDKKRKSRVAMVVDLPLHLKENKIQLLLEDPDEDEKEDKGKDEQLSDESSDSDLDSDSDTDSNSDSDSDSDSDSNSDSDSDSNSNSNSDLKNKVIGKRHRLNKQDNLGKLGSGRKGVPVKIDLTQSSFANARIYFDSKKAAEQLQLKVEKGAEIAYRNAEKKISQDLVRNVKKELGSTDSNALRSKLWFEKFYWFVSSEGYLCLAGRDKTQVDMIYFKYVGDDDYLVSSEIEGSLKVFIKNPIKDEAIPPSTILQAGIFAMSASHAWSGKVNTAAWVMQASDVSKYDSAAGNLLPPGEFEYFAKKDLLPPAQLVMGFGFYCDVDEESAKKHAAIRVEREQEHGLVMSLSNKKKALEKLKVTNVKEGLASGSEQGETERNEKLENHKNTENNGNDGNAKNHDKFFGKDSKSSPMVSRGKQNKLKKAAAKYADQDEEEKALRMKVLGLNKSLKRKDSKEKSLSLPSPQPVSRLPDQDELERKRKLHEQDVETYLVDPQPKIDLADYFNAMDQLTPKPLSSDTIFDMVPVFAPWSALQKFKYKVKIQPGLAKKGKCINETINYFTSRKMDANRRDPDLDWPEERDLINKLRPNDLQGVFTVNKMRLILPQNKK